MLAEQSPCTEDRSGPANPPARSVNGHAKSGLNGYTEKLPLPETLAWGTRHSWYFRIKLGLDFSLALVIMLLSAPVILAAMLLVKLTSRGPALYTQTRVGLDGQPFTIYKLRSMTHQCETQSGVRWSTPGDARVTSVGRILRKTHIDELPQLWNVLRGEMSLIGPRPERPEFVPQLEKAIPLYHTRLLVRPGVTGLAQVQLPPDTNLESVRLKLAYDIWYVQQLSFFLDLCILFATASKLIGLPFRVIRKIFGFAPQEKIVHHYQKLCTPSSSLSRSNLRAACS